MKARPLILTEGVGYSECAAEDATHVELNFPGPIPTRIIPVILKGSRRGTHCWSWNGSILNPTLKPSILSKAGKGHVCHSFVNDGKIQFLSDCSHELAGKTMDLLDVDQ